MASLSAAHRRPLTLPSTALRPMTARDPDEVGRTATPLELLFDLSFVIAFGVAGEELAHLLAVGHIKAGIVGFSFAMFAVVWPGSSTPGSRRSSTTTIGCTGS